VAFALLAIAITSLGLFSACSPRQDPTGDQASDLPSTISTAVTTPADVLAALPVTSLEPGMASVSGQYYGSVQCIYALPAGLEFVGSHDEIGTLRTIWRGEGGVSITIIEFPELEAQFGISPLETWFDILWPGQGTEETADPRLEDTTVNGYPAAQLSWGMALTGMARFYDGWVISSPYGAVGVILTNPSFSDAATHTNWATGLVANLWINP
jgi:hypothetical protein